MIFVYDSDLTPIGIIDRYNSFIAAKRYKENGDCEIYLPASSDALELLKMGRFVGETDDSVIYRINYIELTTDAENGNFITIKGIDSKAFIDQRICDGTNIVKGRAEAFIVKLVNDALGSSASSARAIPNFAAVDGGLPDVITEQVSYKNIGEKVREYCERFGWGYKSELSNGQLIFSVYKGADRSNTVVFAPQYENISTSDYAEDRTNMGNVAYIGGQGEGADRIREQVGTATGADRYEKFVDAREMSTKVTFEQVTEGYPGGIITIDTGGQYYYSVDGVQIAKVETYSPQSSDQCELMDDIYREQLDAKGRDELANYAASVSFQSEIVNRTFEYGKDWFLGDIVKIENEYGITVNARITEIIEVEDENGYSLQPSFEYLTGV